jgi:hypothetical protein
MLITSLGVEGIGRFASAARVDGFGAGVNVLAAGIEVAEFVSLDPISQHAEQQMPWQVRGWLPSKHALPSGTQTLEVEIAQMRDLVFHRHFGCSPRNRSGASHLVRLPVASKAERGSCHP